MEGIAKGLATIAAAIICGFLIYTTDGKSGIGWFVASVFFIW